MRFSPQMSQIYSDKFTDLLNEINMLIDSKLIEIYTKQRGGNLIDVYFVTNGGTYTLSEDNIQLINSFEPSKFELMKVNSVKGSKIIDVRSDWEILLVKFDNGTYLLKGWTINTQNGNGVQYIVFRSNGDIDDEFVEWFNSMQQLNDDHPKYIL